MTPPCLSNLKKEHQAFRFDWESMLTKRYGIQRGRKFDDIPMVEKRLAAVEKPPFAKGKWTRVAFSIANFNTDQPNETANLYLDGNKVRELSSPVQTFTWEPRQAAAMLGLNYIGWMDDLAVFDRALSAEEITLLFSLKDGANELHSKK